jgi:hypothetical protein
MYPPFDRGGLAAPFSNVMPGHSRPKDGVLSHAYGAGIHVSATLQKSKT